MTKFLFKFKKPCFWCIFVPFCQLLGQKCFSEKSDFVTHNFIWLSSTMPKLKKNWYNSNKMLGQTEGQKEGQKDRHNRPYFIRTCQLLQGVQYTASFVTSSSPHWPMIKYIPNVTRNGENNNDEKLSVKHLL